MAKDILGEAATPEHKRILRDELLRLRDRSSEEEAEDAPPPELPTRARSTTIGEILLEQRRRVACLNYVSPDTGLHRTSGALNQNQASAVQERLEDRLVAALPRGVQRPPLSEGTPRSTGRGVRVPNVTRPHLEVPLGKKPHPRDGAKPAAWSDGYATCVDRAYVQKEIRWAVKYQKPIITVYESESHRPGYFDYAKAAEKYKGTEWGFLLGIDAIKYQREQFLAEAMLKNILAKAHGSANVEPAASPINQPGAWGFFLSHHQALGGDQMKTLSLLFKEAGETAWYDNGKLDKSEAAMEEGVKHCKNFVLMLTADAASAASPVVVQPQPEPQQPELLTELRSRTVINSPGRWDVMISYTQRSAEAKRLANSAYAAFRDRGKTVWMDVKMEQLNENAMKEAAQNSACIVAVITGACIGAADTAVSSLDSPVISKMGDPLSNAYFMRDYCVRELRWAREVGTPIQPVIRREDKHSIGKFIKQAPGDLQDLGAIDFISLDDISPSIWATSVDEVLRGVDRLVTEAAANPASFILPTPHAGPEPEPEQEELQPGTLVEFDEGKLPVEPDMYEQFSEAYRFEQQFDPRIRRLMFALGPELDRAAVTRLIPYIKYAVTGIVDVYEDDTDEVLMTLGDGAKVSTANADFKRLLQIAFAKRKETLDELERADVGIMVQGPVEKKGGRTWIENGERQTARTVTCGGRRTWKTRWMRLYSSGDLVCYAQQPTAQTKEKFRISLADGPVRYHWADGQPWIGQSGAARTQPSVIIDAPRSQRPGLELRFGLTYNHWADALAMFGGGRMFGPAFYHSEPNNLASSTSDGRMRPWASHS